MVALAATAALGAGCTSSHEAAGSPPPPAPTTTTEATPGGPPPPQGAMEGIALSIPDGPARERLLEAAAAAADVAARPREPLEITDTEDDFVEDAIGAWTLALAHRATGDPADAEAAAAIVDAWVTTTRTLVAACPDTGACSTSLVLSRAAPGLVQAVDVLRADGAYDDEHTARFHDWLRDVILPAASDRDNNWGDAGTYLRAVAAAELGDDEELAATADRWRERIDLVAPDGQIPEEVRRGDAGLMYSQEALDYKVAAADVLARHGQDVWDYEGDDGGTLRGALDLVARSLEDQGAWPAPSGDLRVPTPAGLWPVVAARWPDAGYDALAQEAARHDDDGHSGFVWTAVTHPVDEG